MYAGRKLTRCALPVRARKVCTIFCHYSTSAIAGRLGYDGGMLLITHILRRFTLLLAVLLLGAVLPSVAGAAIVVQPTPDGGLQPRLLVTEDGNVHLLYFRKRLNQPSAREGNLYYRQYLPSEQRFGSPVKVSSTAFPLQTFAIARAGMAVDGSGRVHVIWYPSRENKFYYARSDAARSQFEPQQSMVTAHMEGVDAGAEIAAQGDKVAIVWGAGDLSLEHERTVFVRLSADNGASFGPELMSGDPALGACACCSLATEYLEDQSLFIGYRSAINGTGRHTQLLTLLTQDTAITGASYGPVNALQEWELTSCPLSTNDVAIAANGDRWFVFETESRIVQLRLAAESIPVVVAEPESKTRQKNPAVAINSEGERLVVWGEGISYNRGGRMDLRLFDAAGNVLDTGFDETIEIPDFSFPAVANLPAGNFLILY